MSDKPANSNPSTDQATDDAFLEDAEANFGDIDLDDSEIDEWAQVGEVDGVISMSTTAEDNADHVDDDSPTSPLPATHSTAAHMSSIAAPQAARRAAALPHAPRASAPAPVIASSSTVLPTPLVTPISRLTPGSGGDKADKAAAAGVTADHTATQGGTVDGHAGRLEATESMGTDSGAAHSAGQTVGSTGSAAAPGAASPSGQTILAARIAAEPGVGAQAGGAGTSADASPAVCKGSLSPPRPLRPSALAQTQHVSRKPPPLNSVFAPSPSADGGMRPALVPPPQPAAAGATGMADNVQATPSKSAGSSTALAGSISPPKPAAMSTEPKKDSESSQVSGHDRQSDDGAVGSDDGKWQEGNYTTATSLWGAWGTGWGALGATLTQAVEATVQDVAELGNSFGQVLTEMADDAEADDDEEVYIATQSRTWSTAAAPLQLVGPKDAEDSEQPIRNVVDRLRNPSGIEESLRTLDAGVDSLAAGAFGALGGLLSKVGAVASAAAQELKDTVEDGVKEISSLHVVQAASTGVAAAPATAGGFVQRLGRSVAFLEDRFGTLQLGGNTSREAAGEPRDAATLSFEACFQTYGGGQCLEELEGLANDCARSVNRARAALSAAVATPPEEGDNNIAVVEQEGLEQLLVSLSSYFTLQAEDAAEGIVEVPGADTTLPPTSLDKGHEVVSELCRSGQQRSQDLIRLGKIRALQLAEQLDEPTALSSTDSNAVVVTVQNEAIKVLRTMQQEAAQKVAEACSLCVERLLALARSLSAQFRFGRPANDGIVWPADCRDKAGALRTQVLHMMRDLQALGDAYKRLLTTVAAAMHTALQADESTSIGSGTKQAASGVKEAEIATDQTDSQAPVAVGIPEACAHLVEDVSCDIATAMARLSDGFRGMLYVVLLTAINRSRTAVNAA